MVLPPILDACIGFKSDRGGIEMTQQQMGTLTNIGFKSDRGGIEINGYDRIRT